VSGNALAFDESSANYVRVPDHEQFHDVTAITTALWFKGLESSSSIYFLVSKDYETYEMHTGGYSGTNGIRVQPSAGWGINKGSAFVANEWTHIACVYNQLIPSVELYINGNSVSFSFTGAYYFGSTINVGSADIVFGSRSTQINNFPLYGQLDEIFIYRRALLQSEVEDLYNLAYITQYTTPDTTITYTTRPTTAWPTTTTTAVSPTTEQQTTASPTTTEPTTVQRVCCRHRLGRCNTRMA
jgi:hypothetical protein